MFNFDTTVTKGKYTYKIVDNAILGDVTDAQGKNTLSAVNCNAIIKHWLETVIKPQVNSAKVSKNFEENVKESRYLQQALAEVLNLKSLNCYQYNKDRENLSYELKALGDQFFTLIKKNFDSYSPAQRLVLSSINKGGTGVDTNSVQELYDPITNDATKLEEWWDGLQKFDYSKYDLHESILDDNSDNYFYCPSHKTCYENVKNKIDLFQTILKEAGDDLVNWSDQKISLRFTKLGIKANARDITDYVSAYVEHLLSKGVKKAEVKKNTAKYKVKEAVNRGVATQDDYFKYYKQASGYDSQNVLKLMDFEHQMMLIESDLKCITKKLKANGEARANNLTQEGALLASMLCQRSVTKEDYKKIFNWAGAGNMTLAFMLKHTRDTNKKDVLEFAERTKQIPTDLVIPDDFYDAYIKDCSYELDKGVTYQKMFRLSESEKIKTLKTLAKSDRFEYAGKTLLPLYATIDYKLFRETVRDNSDLHHDFVERVLDENDVETMLVILEESMKGLLYDKLVRLLKSVPKEDMLRILEKDAISERDTESILSSIKHNDLITLLKRLSGNSRATTYFNNIIATLVESKNAKSMQIVDEVIKNTEDVATLKVTEEMVVCLTLPTKKILLQKGVTLYDEVNYNLSGCYYGSSITKPNTTSIEMGNSFFSDFKREDIVEAIGEDFLNYEYLKFLAHVLKREELESVVENEYRYWNENTANGTLRTSFLRYNLDKLQYGFLKRFKDKSLFRIVVGDRRNSDNASFGNRLLKKIEVNNSIDFMFED